MIRETLSAHHGHSRNATLDGLGCLGAENKRLSFLLTQEHLREWWRKKEYQEQNKVAREAFFAANSFTEYAPVRVLSRPFTKFSARIRWTQKAFLVARGPQADLQEVVQYLSLFQEILVGSHLARGKLAKAQGNRKRSKGAISAAAGTYSYAFKFLDFPYATRKASSIPSLECH